MSKEQLTKLLLQVRAGAWAAVLGGTAVSICRSASVWTHPLSPNKEEGSEH